MCLYKLYIFYFYIPSFVFNKAYLLSHALGVYSVKNDR